MTLTAHQPVYIPWLGLFHKIFLAEKFCIFDIAQYQVKDYNNRNYIKTHQGEIWLSVPVESKNHFQKKICDIKIIENGWRKKHMKSIELAYKKASYYNDYIEGLEQILIGKNQAFLTDLNTDILKFMLEAFEINIPMVKASDFDFTGTKSDLVLDMCVKLEANKYIFGNQGRNYADIDAFQKNNISTYFQEYNHPIYKQLHGSFLPNMSALDLLFKEGPKSKEIILSGNITNV